MQDAVAVLADSKDPKQYIKKMRTRDPELNANWGTICTPVQMIAADGKRRKVQAASTEGLLRIIQSIPSPKAEPFKLWLAQVGRERIEEIIDPELTIERALDTYAKKGYPAEWINQRLQTIRARKELTDAWKDHGVQEGKEYAILTDEVTKAWSGMNTRQYKNLKGLKKENLFDEQNISKDTRVLLSLMYRNYWCDEATKIELLHQDLLEKQKYEEELREKYNVDNIFKNRNKEIDIEETIVKEEIHALTEYKEKNFIQKIFDKIKSIFKRK